MIELGFRGLRTRRREGDTSDFKRVELLELKQEMCGIK